MRRIQDILIKHVDHLVQSSKLRIVHDPLKSRNLLRTGFLAILALRIHLAREAGRTDAQVSLRRRSYLFGEPVGDLTDTFVRFTPEPSLIFIEVVERSSFRPI